MKIKGINYDVGVFTTKDVSSRPIFEKAIVSREVEIIAKDLHCNAIRISGQDIDRLIYASECALKQGLEVWISPQLHGSTQAQTLEYLKQCSASVEKLHRTAQIIFVLGCEFTFFMEGLVLGSDSTERMQTFAKPWKLIKSTVLKGSFNRNLNWVLKEAVQVVRANFSGKVTYASGAWEKVDWSLFDIVSVDYYRDSYVKRNYIEKLNAYKKFGKPLVVTEFGCCTYSGAEEKGGYGWAIVDRTKTPPELKGNFVRSEDVQAKLITELLDIYENANVDGAFVFTFIMPKYPYDEIPQYNLDTASYAIVKSLPNGKGETYPNMPWEPKRAFTVLAKRFLK